MKALAFLTYQTWRRSLLAWVVGLSGVGLPASPSPMAYGAAAFCPTTEAALEHAMTGAGDRGTVKLYCVSPTTITFSTAIVVDRNLILDGRGSPGSVTLDGGSTSQLFNVTGSLRLEGLTVTNASSAEGGAISIEAPGVLAMIDSTFSNNTADAYGGAIVNNGGTVTVTSSTFSHNTTSDYGGAISNWGSLTVINSRFLDNSSHDSPGGAIDSEVVTLRIANSTFAGNSGGAGGAIFGSNIAIAGSTFSNNSARYSPGGAIYHTALTLSVTNSTFVNNISEGVGYGGAIYNATGTVNVASSTLAGNSAASGGGAIGNGGDGTVTATIMAGNSGGNCAGNVTDGGYNLSDDNGAGCGFNAATDIHNVNPRLGPLASYGGSTQTMALLPTGPALAAIPVSSGDCPKTDQRGVIRPDNGELFCDVGAYEYAYDARATAPILKWSQPAAITYGKAISGLQLNASAVNKQGHPVDGTFGYSPLAGTYLHAGVRTLKATFYSSRTTDYRSGGTISTAVRVDPANLIVKANNQSAPEGFRLPTLTWHADFIGTDTASSLKVRPSCSTTATTGATHNITSVPGIYQITCARAVDPDYVIYYAPGTLRVKAPVRVTGHGMQARKTVSFIWVASGTQPDGFNVLALTHHGKIIQVNKTLVRAHAGTTYTFIAHNITSDIVDFYLDVKAGSASQDFGPFAVTG